METKYAGFWMRFVAWIIDAIIIGCLNFIVIVPIIVAMGMGVASEAQTMDSDGGQSMMSMISKIMAAGMVANLVILVIQILYHTLMEASKMQGSVGKLALGLKVTDVNGAPLDFTKALIRNICKIISGIILGIGYFMAGFTDKKQALHDMIASTLVVKK